MSKDDPSYTTTGEHYKVFIAECNKWINKFHLRSWRISFENKDNPEVPDSFAWCMYNLKGRISTLGLSISWGHVEPTIIDLKKSAFHEVCELLLARLEAEALVDTCPTQKSDIEEHKHAIIRRLEYAVWEGSESV